MTPTEQGPVISRAPYAILAVAGIVIATVFAAMAALATEPATQASPVPIRPGPVATNTTTSATPRSAASAPAPVVTSTELLRSTTTDKPTTTTSRTRPATTVRSPAFQPPASSPAPPPPPEPKPPVAAFTVTCQRGSLTCTFDASGSHDPDGTLIFYAWDLGDGTRPMPAGRDVTRVTHTYRAAGTYRVTMAVMDNSGKTATTSRDARVVGG